MRDYIHGLLYVCLAPFDYGFDRTMAFLAVGGLLLGFAALFFLLSKKKKLACLPILCAAAALSPSFFVNLALSRGVSISFLNQYSSKLIIYAAFAAAYSLPGILAGWLVYLVWNRFRTLGKTDL